MRPGLGQKDRIWAHERVWRFKTFWRQRHAQKHSNTVPCRTREGSGGSRLDYQPLFGKMSPHSSPLFGEDQSPDPGDGGNRAYGGRGGNISWFFVLQNYRNRNKIRPRGPHSLYAPLSHLKDIEVTLPRQISPVSWDLSCQVCNREK